MNKNCLKYLFKIKKELNHVKVFRTTIEIKEIIKKSDSKRTLKISTTEIKDVLRY
jgi:hypothetical protein